MNYNEFIKKNKDNPLFSYDVHYFNIPSIGFQIENEIAKHYKYEIVDNILIISDVCGINLNNCEKELLELKKKTANHYNRDYISKLYLDCKSNHWQKWQRGSQATTFIESPNKKVIMESNILYFHHNGKSSHDWIEARSNFTNTTYSLSEDCIVINDTIALKIKD